MSAIYLTLFTNRVEELESKEKQQQQQSRGGGGTAETREERAKRLTRQNARLRGKRDHLRQIKTTLDGLDEELVRKFKVAHQNYMFTMDIYKKGGRPH